MVTGDLNGDASRRAWTMRWAVNWMCLRVPPGVVGFERMSARAHQVVLRQLRRFVDGKWRGLLYELVNDLRVRGPLRHVRVAAPDDEDVRLRAPAEQRRERSGHVGREAAAMARARLARMALLRGRISRSASAAAGDATLYQIDSQEQLEAILAQFKRKNPRRKRHYSPQKCQRSGKVVTIVICVTCPHAMCRTSMRTSRMV